MREEATSGQERGRTDSARHRPRRRPEADVPDGDEGAMVRAITARAIRRLDILEYAILTAAAVLALVAGALVAWLVASVTEWAFRPVWIVASLLLFVVPALVAWWQGRRGEAPSAGTDRA